MKLIYIFFLLLLSSCATSKKSKVASNESISSLLKTKELNQVMMFTDLSGKFSIKRTMKLSKNKLLFQRMIYQDDFSKFVERTRSVSMLSFSEEDGESIKPAVSQYRGWFEGSEYSNQIKISYAKKEVEVLTKVKDKKYPAKTIFSLPPDTKKMCFFHMIPECIKLWGLNKTDIEKSNNEFWFYLIMDAYPFLDLLYTNVPNKWIAEATLVYDGKQDKEHQFSLEFNDQAISIKYNENWDFIGLYWVSQGVNMVSN